jgi:hypothetical protein
VQEDEESNTLQTVNGRLPKQTSLAGFVLLITNESYQTTFCEVEADLFHSSEIKGFRSGTALTPP